MLSNNKLKAFFVVKLEKYKLSSKFIYWNDIEFNFCSWSPAKPRSVWDINDLETHFTFIWEVMSKQEEFSEPWTDPGGSTVECSGLEEGLLRSDLILFMGRRTVVVPNISNSSPCDMKGILTGKVSWILKSELRAREFVSKHTCQMAFESCYFTKLLKYLKPSLWIKLG